MVYLNYSESCYNGTCQTWQMFQIKRSMAIHMVEQFWENGPKPSSLTLFPEDFMGSVTHFRTH